MSLRDKANEERDGWLSSACSRYKKISEVTVDDSKLMVDLSKEHNEFIRIARMFLSREDAEDVVQDMYTIAVRRHDDYSRFYMRDTGMINMRYMYTIIKNLCLDFMKSKRMIRVPMMEDSDYSQENGEYKPYFIIPVADEADEEYEAMNLLFNKVSDEISKWSPYESQLFTLYMYSGLSLRDIAYGTENVDKAKAIDAKLRLTESGISRGSGISVNSLWTTLTACKERLKEALAEDFEDYFNGDFEFIY